MRTTVGSIPSAVAAAPHGRVRLVRLLARPVVVAVAGATTITTIATIATTTTTLGVYKNKNKK